MSRRTLAAGAAWAVPLIAYAGAAPSFAVSTPPGLQGWVLMTKICSAVNGNRTRRTMTINMNGLGNYPNRGLWVYNTSSATALAEARIAVYFPSDWTITNVVAVDGNSGWSIPALDTTVDPRPGMTAYSTSYSGSWTHVAATGSTPAYSYATGRPHFTSTAQVSTGQGYCAESGFPITVFRTVTVDGTAVAFTRSILL